MSDNNSVNIWYSVLKALIIAIVFILIGFLLGRCSTTKEKEIVTEYVELPAVHDTIVTLKPYKVIPPIDTLNILKQCIEDGIYSELFPEKIITDTVFTSTDTSKILQDWATKRRYSQNLFDNDTIGRCDVGMVIQYNRVDTFAYTYIPIQKQTTEKIKKVPMISPFIGIGMMSNPSFDAEAGIFIKDNFGVSFKYQYEIYENKHNFGGALIYKF